MLLANHVDRHVQGLDTWLADLLRFATLSLTTLILGFTAWTIRAYYRAYRNAPTGRHGILPHHVWMIGVSYVILTAEAAWENVERLGHPPTAYIPVNFFAFGIGAYALWLILRFERRVVSVKATTYQVEATRIVTHDDLLGEEWDGKERRHGDAG